MKRMNAGFTLIEMLAVLVVLVILVAGMGATMNTGMLIYNEAVFESDSASMAGILNTALGDILRYSVDIEINEGTAANPEDAFVDASGSYILKDDVGFVFTSVEYGIRDAYFHIPYEQGNKARGVLQMRNLVNSDIVELVNIGAYPDLMVNDFEITYVAPGAPDSNGNPLRGGYFEISYEILSKSNPQLKREVETVVRLINISE
ncbi:MAG: prepilin-type N-terminal cleavage/methylation domain-containing protein [Oscillospiraceae bacterium]|nr:prepilin-type N-terminal cleavage/methylation domain-containing protein [Oscillospiraceae bacterium]